VHLLILRQTIVPFVSIAVLQMILRRIIARVSAVLPQELVVDHAWPSAVGAHAADITNVVVATRRPLRPKFCFMIPPNGLHHPALALLSTTDLRDVHHIHLLRLALLHANLRRHEDAVDVLRQTSI